MHDHAHAHDEIGATERPGYFDILETALEEMLIERKILQPGEVERRLPREAAETRVADFGIRQIDAGMAGIADLEQQRLGGEQRRAGVRLAQGSDAGGTALGVHAHLIGPRSGLPRGIRPAFRCRRRW